MMVVETQIEAWLDRERARVDDALAAIASERVPEIAPGLREPVEYALSTRGKRLRPILTVAAYRAVTGEREADSAVYRLGAAVEIVHTYSLVHDDLPAMDDDDLRRGRPTVHRVHGVPAAIVAGAALLPLSVQVLVDAGRELGLEPVTVGTLASELCYAAGACGMVGGQLQDLEAERREVSAADLESIHRAKTGALLTVSLRLGAIAAGADEHTLAALTAYGESLGLAFQITDDVLDVAGDSAALGKTAGRDEALRKASYPSLFGLDGARKLARDRCEEAKAALDGVAAHDLVALAEYVVSRER